VADALTAEEMAIVSRKAQPQELTSTTLVVDNMHCGGCMRKVEAALTAVTGIASARADLSARRVIAIGRDVATVELIDALMGAGFKAAPLVDEASDAEMRADRDFLKRLGVAGFAAANVMLLSVSVWSASSGDMTPAVQSLFHWLSALIALPAVVYSGSPFFRSAARALTSRRVNMDVPISLGVVLATLMSLYQTVRGSEQVYFDAAITLLFFLLLGRFLDQRMRVRAAGAAANLLGLRGATATVLQADGSTSRVTARALAPGMRVLTAAGERFAVDGRVIEGRGQVDQSLITGETMPRAVDIDALIYAGTVNLSGPLVTEATATDQNTLLAEISRLMAAAEQSRGRYVRLADRAAGLYAPAVHILGAATFIGWMLAGHSWDAALTAAIAVLIITCPCALALAVPAVQVAATSRLFRSGALVKAPDALERLAEIDTVVFDKTGTLTLGEPELVHRDDHSSGVPNRVLARAAAIASGSRHPYARAICRAASAEGLSVHPSSNIREEPGQGLECASREGIERLGSANWCGVDASTQPHAVVWYRAPHGTTTGFQFEDRLRPDATAVISSLRAAGLSVELLSGDRTSVVAEMARQAGVETWRAAALPGDKIARLDALRAAGHRVLMIGDGLNDAPALAAGHASLSPSSAADIAQTAADVIFQGDRLAPVLDVLAVARMTRRMALQNFAIALGYNCIFVPLAVIGVVTPLLAAIAMSASSIAVTANAVRLASMRLGGKL
jgi:P-type Cu2+ transporter